MELWLIPTFSGGAARDVIERPGGGHGREEDTVGRRTRSDGRRTRPGGGRSRGRCGLRLLLVRSWPVTGS